MLDKFSLYILDQIEKYRHEIDEEPTEKEINEILINELLMTLGKYYTTKCIQA